MYPGSRVIPLVWLNVSGQNRADLRCGICCILTAKAIMFAKREPHRNSLRLFDTYREQEVESEEQIFDDFHGALHLERRLITVVSRTVS